jgi:predicted kinase
LQARTEHALALLRPLIEERARRGVPCETHGDLHAEHVYLFPDRPPPDDLIVIDGIEFNERFRYADPVADVAFLVMDLKFRGREDLARVFADSWFAASGDHAGLPLLPFYTAYRAMVRGKVEGFALTEEEIPPDERAADCVLARAHWLLALQELETSTRRPCLVLIGGLPGSGKSTLARGLAEHAGFEVIRTDIVRKQWAIPGELLYTPVWTDRTYDECLRRAERLLIQGQRVVVDATFVEDVWRRAFLDLARSLSTPAILFICQVAPETARQRLAQRRGDASDAGWAVYEKLARRWQKPGGRVRPFVREISSTKTPAEVLAQASAELSRLGVWEG